MAHFDKSARIIPADAGSTQHDGQGAIGRMDHPRGCGEHNSGDERNATLDGSSPRMRGAPDQMAGGGQKQGIIPADAGSTLVPTFIRLPVTDHPRGCGEHIRRGAETQIRVGSSPRMRGALQVAPGRVEGRRIIPADAGSTRAARRR